MIMQRYSYRTFEKKRGLLINLMDNPRERAGEIHHHGFSKKIDLLKYYDLRLVVEEIMYAKLIRLGGKPTIKHPFYFSLDAPIDGKFYDEPMVIKMKVSEFPPKAVSFTVFDSMYSMLSRESLPTNRRIFMVDQMDEVLAQYEHLIPVVTDEAFIEVQLWDCSVLKEIESNKIYRWEEFNR